MKRYNKQQPPLKEVIDYFPRGNTKKDDFSFNTAMIDHSASVKKVLTKKHKRLPSAEEKEAELEIQSETTTRVMLPQFKIGDLCLFAITEIRKDYMIANYSRNKKAMIHSSYSGLDYEDDAFSFKKLFSIGQFVAGAIVRPGNDIHLSNGHINKKILISIDPKIVNTGMKKENIVSGMDLYGMLVLDDEGKYTVDFRLKDDTSDDFDDLEDEKQPYKSKTTLIVNLIDEENACKSLIVGSYYFFKVTKTTSNKKERTIDVVLSTESKNFGIKSIDFKVIKPGFMFKANVTRDMVNGKEISFGGNIGSIFIDHIKQDMKSKGAYVRVIHVATGKHKCSLSSLPHIINLSLDDVEEKEGLIGKKFHSEVVKEIYGKSFLVSLENEDKKTLAFLHKDNIVLEKEGEQELKVGDKADVLVKEYNFFDDQPIVTMKSSSTFMTWDNIKVGDFVKCTVKSVGEKEIICSLTQFIDGRIPLEHLTDHPMKKMPKKFKPSMELEARIFSFDSLTKNLVLTMKPTLMEKEVALYSSLEEMKEGEDVYVVYLGNGLFGHANNIIGTLLKFKTMNQSDFKKGKIYQYKVYKIDLNSRKIFFTADKQIWIPGCGDFETFVRRNHLITTVASTMNTFDAENIEEGNLVKCAIVNKEKFVKAMSKRDIDSSLIKEGIVDLFNNFIVVKFVTNESSGNYYAFVKKEHCADFKVKEMFDFYSSHEGEEFSALVLYHNKSSNLMFLTFKKSLIDNRDSIIHFDESIENIKKQNIPNDKLYYGYVNKVTSKGVMAQFYGKKKVILRNEAKHINYSEGRTIMVRFKNGKFLSDVDVYAEYSQENFERESEELFNIFIAEHSLLYRHEDVDMSSSKIKTNKEYDIKITNLDSHYITGEVNKEKVFIICNLFNFSLNENNELKFIEKDSTIKATILSYSNELGGYIAKVPSDLIEKIKSLIKKPSSSSSNKSIGDVISCKINGIKKGSIFGVVDKHTLCRMEITNYKGNIDQVRNLLQKTIPMRKKSTESKGSSSCPPELKLRGKIVDVLNKKKIKIYELAPIDPDEINTDVLNEQLSTSIINDGVTENLGMISHISQTSNFPIHITIAKGNEENKLKIPFSDIPVEEVTSSGILYHVGSKIRFYVDSEGNCSLHPIKKKKEDEPIKIGQVYVSRILKSISSRGLVIQITPSAETFVDITEITDYLHSNPLTYYAKGQIVKCRVLSHDEKSNRYLCSLRGSIVEEEDYSIIKSGSTLQFNQRFNVPYDIRNKVLKYGVDNSIENNTLAIGYIVSSSEKGTFIKIASNVTVRAAMRELTDEPSVTKAYLLYKENTICLCRIISIYKNANGEKSFNVSLRKSVIKYPITMKKKDIVLNNFYQCVVLSKAKKGYEVSVLGSTYVGLIKPKNIKNGSVIEIGKSIVLQLIKLNLDKANTKLRFSNVNIDDGFDMKLVINAVSEEVVKKGEENEEVYNSIREILLHDENENNMNELINMNDVQDNEIDYEELISHSRKMSENIGQEKEEEEEINEDVLEEEPNIVTDREEKLKLLSGVEEENNDKMDVDEKESENEEEQEKQNVSSAAHREKGHLNKELKIREAEQKETEEKNAEYYEKLILSDHDNSLYWIQYASYILENLNIASARKIFERAIKTVDISKTKDKLNIYIAYMNLENIYGSTESFKGVVERALEVNDKKEIYLHLIQIYSLSKKYSLCNDIFKLLVKEYHEVELWKKYIEFVIKNEAEIDITAKECLNSALQSVEKNKNIEVIVFYAQTCYKYGKLEEGRNYFDTILKSTPKRTDIWFVYCDMEVKFGNEDKAVNIYERMISVEFKPKALKSVMKKYLEFYKDRKDFEKAKNKAEEIIQRRMSEKSQEEEE